MNVPLNSCFLSTPLKGLSLQDYVNTHAIQPERLSVQALWPGAGVDSVHAQAWRPLVLLLHLRGSMNFVGLASGTADAGSYLCVALLPPCLDFGAAGRLSSSEVQERLRGCMNKITQKTHQGKPER